VKLTHYERQQQMYGPFRKAGQEIADRHGWKGYFEHLFASTSSTSPKQKLDDRAKLSVAIVEGMVRKLMGADPYGLDALFSNPKLLEFVQVFETLLNGAMGSGIAFFEKMKAQIIAIWQIECHRLSGEHVFEVSSGLGETLLQTELRGLQTDDLQLPFRNLYVACPESAGIKVFNLDSGLHTCDGFYITEDTASPLGRVWRILACAPSKNPDEPWDDALFFFSIVLPAGVSLEDALEQEQKRSEAIDIQATASTTEFYRTYWQTMFRWLMNVVVYATWPDAEKLETLNPEYAKRLEQVRKHPKGSHKRERAAELLKATLPQRRIVLGRSVPRFEAESGTGKALAVRTLVRGHWQRFAHGPERSLRKWAWRKPFWRGPVDAPESNPIHELRE